jgi:hypothetical protein
MSKKKGKPSAEQPLLLGAAVNAVVAPLIVAVYVVFVHRMAPAVVENSSENPGSLLPVSVAGVFFGC